MAIAPYLRRLRQLVGHDLLVVPSVAVIPTDAEGRLLLVRNIDTGDWQTIGGAVEPDESPQDAAVRETREEAGVDVSLGAVLGVVGGPGFRVTYPNGDVTAYVTTAFAATVVSGTPTGDGDETSAAAWWTRAELPELPMSPFTRRLLDTVRPTPTVLLVTGPPGTGKSELARHGADLLAAPVLSWDWAMAALTPFEPVQAAIDTMGRGGKRQVGWALLEQLTAAQLRHGRPAVIDGVARRPEVERIRRVCDDHGARLVVVATSCHDRDLHRRRIEGRRRAIPGWHELDWRDVEASLSDWDPPPDALRLDAGAPLTANRAALAVALGAPAGGTR